MIMFVVRQTPSGMWRLEHKGVDMGLFSTKEEAEKGIERIVRPTVFEYNEEGRQTK